MFSVERTLSVCSYSGKILLRACLSRYGFDDDINKRFVRLKSHYEVLGVDRNASQEKIKEQFINLSKKHHPDISADKQGSHEKFVRINEAYKVLSNRTNRNQYDAQQRYGNAQQRYGSAHSRNPYTRGPPPYQQNMYDNPFHGRSPYGDPDFKRWDQMTEAERRAQEEQNKKGAETVKFIHLVILSFMFGLILHFAMFGHSHRIDELNERDRKSFMILQEARARSRLAGSSESSLNEIHDRVLNRFPSTKIEELKDDVNEH